MIIKATGLQGFIPGRAAQSVFFRKAAPLLIAGKSNAFGHGLRPCLVFLGEAEGKEKTEKEAEEGGFQQGFPVLPEETQMMGVKGVHKRCG